MENPFKKIGDNAKKTKSKTQFKDEKKTATVQSRTCEQCGAPRPRNTDLATCDYCGFKFMDIGTTVKSDN